jgi:hypothetical protein
MTLYPNHIFVCEWSGDNPTKEWQSHFVIVVAASDKDTARTHVRDKIGIDVLPTAIMGVYRKLYVSDGSVPLSIQAKILYNGRAHWKL